MQYIDYRDILSLYRNRDKKLILLCYDIVISSENDVHDSINLYITDLLTEESACLDYFAWFTL